MSTQGDGMAEVTEADRDKVVAIIKQAMADEKWLPPQPYKLHVYRLAAALAEEREKARAPFLALADELDHEATYTLASAPKVAAKEDAADRIRRAAEETE